MDIKVRLIKKEELLVLERLLQLYLHDISLYFPIEFDSDKGLYSYDDLSKYFNASNNYPYFIECNNSIVGFILIDVVDDCNIVQEIFVINNYKKLEIGKVAINKIFDTYKGKWIIKSLPKSEKAEKFWKRTIDAYTCGNYSVEKVGKYSRAVFTFDNKEKMYEV